jgi:signal transduction histidine kinase
MKMLMVQLWKGSDHMKSIRTRFFLQILIPVMLLYTLFITLGVLYIGESYRDNALHQKQVSLSMVVQGVDKWFLSRVSEVLQLSRIPILKSSDTEAVQGYLLEWRNTLSFRYDSLFLVEPDGSFWNSREETGILDESTYTDLFFKEGALFTFGGPRRYGTDFRKFFIIGAPIKNAAGKTEHILTAAISLETLHRVFSFFTFEDFDSWMVVNPRSIIVIHDDFDMVGLSERAEYGKSFLFNEEWNDKYVFVSPLTIRSGWKLVTFLDKNRLILLYRQFYSLFIWFSLILFITAALLVLILSNTVSRPIIKLTNGVHRIMAGDFKERIYIKTGDELSQLANSFNRLAGRMSSLRTEDRFNFLGHIAARMAHELRKPLHVIQLAAQSMQRDNAKLPRNLEIIDQEIENADRFVNEILNFAHTEKMEKVKYSITRLLEAVIEKYRFITDKYGIELVFTKMNDVPEIYMDVIRMEEVFSNILQNAVDAVRASKRPVADPEISVTLELTDAMEILISFYDNGDGFDEQLIDQMFDPYFTTKPEGTGLGLSLSYRIIAAHGYKIELINDAQHHGVVKITISI